MSKATDAPRHRRLFQDTCISCTSAGHGEGSIQSRDGLAPSQPFNETKESLEA